MLGRLTTLLCLFTTSLVAAQVELAEANLSRAQGLDAADELIADIMTPEPETLTPDDQLVYALNIMAVGGFRHVPIVADERLVGIISIRDIHKRVLEHFEQEILTLPPRPVTEAAPQTRYGG